MDCDFNQLRQNVYDNIYDKMIIVNKQYSHNKSIQLVTKRRNRTEYCCVVQKYWFTGSCSTDEEWTFESVFSGWGSVVIKWRKASMVPHKCILNVQCAGDNAKHQSCLSQLLESEFCRQLCFWTSRT